MDYKNVEPLVQSLRYLPDYQLHLCSPISPERRAELIEVATRHGAAESQLYFHNGITDDDYRDLLRQSTALVTASRSEGYGLPVAEAMAEGTPVVLSNLEIFQEIGGADHPGALFVDLADSDLPRQLADRVLLLEDDERFAAASTAATRQAQKFRWDESATALLRLAEDIHRRRTLRSH